MNIERFQKGSKRTLLSAKVANELVMKLEAVINMKSGKGIKITRDANGIPILIEFDPSNNG